ncbi:MAG: NAD(P)(+) transhydrogenase (Re/Si-specific) subunit beta, partial [Chloroflexota bacterium]
MIQGIINIAYLISAILVIIGLQKLGSPATARVGNWYSAAAMGLATVATLLTPGLRHHWIMLVGIILGAVISIPVAQRVKMTAMPQMVAMFNGTGGAASALVSVAEFQNRTDMSRPETISVVLGTIIGAISFTGSMVAFAKLQELITGRPIVYKGQQVLNGVLFLAMVALSFGVIFSGDLATQRLMLLGVLVVALIVGALIVLPIGGADMPVVIAMQNALTGVASIFTGLVLGNQLLVIAGLLVGASGVLLSMVMARAMNRSLANVFFGAFGSVATGGAAGVKGEALPIKSLSAEDAGVPLAYADRVIIVP